MQNNAMTANDRDAVPFPCSFYAVVNSSLCSLGGWKGCGRVLEGDWQGCDAVLLPVRFKACSFVRGLLRVLYALPVDGTFCLPLLI